MVILIHQLQYKRVGDKAMDEMYNNVNNKKGTSGIPLIVVGLIFLFATIEFNVLFSKAMSSVPDDAQWCEAKVTEVISCEERRERDSDGDGYKKVYDCEYVIEYQVGGQTYNVEMNDNDRSSKVTVGSYLYVKVTEADPERIYIVSTSPSDGTFKGFFIVFYVVSGAIVVAGIVLQVRRIMNKRKNSNEGNVLY